MTNRIAASGRMNSLLALALIAGCRAGTDHVSPAIRTESGGVVAPGGRVDHDTTAEELAHTLGSTNAGRTLLRAVDAHGGWSRWVELTAIEYRRARSHAPNGSRDDGAEDGGDGPIADAPIDAARESGDVSPPPDGEGAFPSASREVEMVVLDPREWRSLSGNDVERDEAELVFAPFFFLRANCTIEYLGVEYDPEDDVAYDKLRVADLSDERRSWIGFFGGNSGLLHRILRPRADGRWERVSFGGWVDAAGLRWPTTRSVHLLESRFRRASERTFAWRDELGEWSVR